MFEKWKYPTVGDLERATLNFQQFEAGIEMYPNSSIDMKTLLLLSKLLDHLSLLN
jgi:hypothetical protein